MTQSKTKAATIINKCMMREVFIAYNWESNVGIEHKNTIRFRKETKVV